MNTLKAEKRNLHVKARKLRREGYVTGNLFGRKIEGSIPLQMTSKDIGILMSREKKGGQVNLEVDGTVYDALIKDVEFNSLLNRFDEIDFQALVSDEQVHSVAEIIYKNEEKVTSGVLQITLAEIPYKAYPSALVSEVLVDVGVLRVNDVLRVKDLDIAKNKNINLTIDPETVVASVREVHNNIPETTVETTIAAAPTTPATPKTKAE